MKLVIPPAIWECEKRAVAPGIRHSRATLHYIPTTYDEKFLRAVENESDVVADAHAQLIQRLAEDEVR